MTASAIRIEGLSKTFGVTRVLHDLAFDLPPGHVTALLGENGCGKSTLIKILAGVEHSDPGGEVTVAGRPVVDPTTAHEAGVRVVHQTLALFDDFSITENLLSTSMADQPWNRIGWSSAHRRATTVLERVGLDVDVRRPVRTLRPSEKALVAIARALPTDEASMPTVLILDEPTANLPEPEAERLLEAIVQHRQMGHTIIFVTHRLGEALAVADSMIVMRDGRITAVTSPREVTPAQLSTLISGQELAPQPRHNAVVADSDGDHRDRPSTPPRVEIAVGEDGVDLQAQPGEVLGLAGLADSGGAELLLALFGHRRLTDAHLMLDGKPFAPRSTREAMLAGVAYVPGDRAGLAAFRGFSVKENLDASLLADPHLRRSVRGSSGGHAVAGLIQDLDVRPADPMAPMWTLSGGNQQKVILGRWLRRNPRLLLLDEPTQGVDVGARHAIHARIREIAARGVTTIVVSSDLDELVDVCDRVAVMSRGQVRELIRQPVERDAISTAIYRAEAGDR